MGTIRHRQTINNRLTLYTQEDHPGRLGVIIDGGAGSKSAALTYLSPEEVDHLVLHALGMTKPEDPDQMAEGDYAYAVSAVRQWQATKAQIETRRATAAERDQILKDAGFTAPHTSLSPMVQNLVDQVLTERRKAEQK